MIFPSLFEIISLINILVNEITDVERTLKNLSSSSIGVFSKELGNANPALFTRTFILYFFDLQ